MFGQARTRFEQRALDLAARDVAGVHDAPLAVPALAPEIELAVRRARKFGAELHEPAHGVGALAHAELDDHVVAEPGARRHRVLDVLFERVVGREHGGDAALRPARGGVVRAARLVTDHDLAVTRRAQGEGEPGDAAAEHEKVGDDRQSPAFLASNGRARRNATADKRRPGQTAELRRVAGARRAR